MMTRTRSLRACLIPLLMLGLLAAPAMAQDAPDRQPPDPQTVADHAIEKVEGIADRCGDRLEGIADKAIAKYEESDGEAKHLLRRAISGINATAARCAQSVRSVNRRSVGFLRKAGEDVLADEVQTASEDAIAAIRLSRGDAAAQVKAVLDAQDQEAGS